MRDRRRRWAGVWTTCALAWLAISACATAADRFDHSLLDSVLQRFVDDDGLVDYAGLKRDSALLSEYCDLLADVSPENNPERFPTSGDSLAYWINAYNAFVLKGVVDAYPVASVKDIRLFYGFFKREEFIAGGRKLTLDDIEHGTIRKQFDEPRIHAAVNCGAISCPRLQRNAYTAADLDAQLDRAMREFAGGSVHVQLDRDSRTVRLSRLFDWYGEDFTGWLSNPDPTVLDYITQYRDESDRAFLGSAPKLKLDFMKYDWSLNDQASGR
jgi:hypothetical protein